MNEQPGVWRPRPEKTSRTWLSRRSPGENIVIWIESKVIFRIVLVIIRNFIPLVGFVEFGWSAHAVVILGVFNFAMVFASSTSVECALPTLVVANPRQERAHIIVWTIVTVCAAWVTVVCATFLAPALASSMSQTPVRGFAEMDQGVWWLAAGLSIAAALAFASSLREQLQRLRALDPPPRMKNRSVVGAIAGLFFGQAALAYLGLWLVVMPLLDAKFDDGPLLAVVIVSASTLFLDAIATFWPTEMPQMPGVVRARCGRGRYR